MKEAGILFGRGGGGSEEIRIAEARAEAARLAVEESREVEGDVEENRVEMTMRKGIAS